MEPVGHEKNRQPLLNFKCEKILSHLDDSSSSATKFINKEKCKLETDEEVFASPTPVKAPQLSRRSKKLEEVKLPDNFQIVGELFDGLETSVRLLRLCKKPVTFQNVCIQVEILTKRKLLYKHLAQMKYVMPEFILVESTFVHDQRSFCMLPDMKISLLPSTSEKTETFIIRSEAGDSKSKPLRDVFWARLREIFQDHPEAVDIPEATLPEAFNSNSDTFSNEVSSSVTTDSTAGMPWTHFASSFEQRFSNVLQGHQEMEAPLLSLSAPDLVTGNTSNSFMSPIKQESEFKRIGSSRSAASIIKPHLGQCSPVAHPPTPAQTMPKVVAVQGTPKGSAEIRTALNINRRRSLKFTCENADGSDSEQIFPLNEENGERGYSTCKFKKLVGPPVDKEASGRIPPAFPPKDMGTANKMTSGHKMCEADVARHEGMLLTDLFSTICRILQAAKCPYFTKQELLHKILFYSSETFETGEIEEKLKLLEELAPEWISQKISSSGDFLYCFSKGSGASAIYARLAGSA